VAALRAPTTRHLVEQQPRRGAEGARVCAAVGEDLGWDPPGHRCQGGDTRPAPDLLSSLAPSLLQPGITELIKIGRGKNRPDFAAGAFALILCPKQPGELVSQRGFATGG